MCPSINQLIFSLFYSFIYSFIRSFIYSFIHSFILSFIHSGSQCHFVLMTNADDNISKEVKKKTLISLKFLFSEYILIDEKWIKPLTHQPSSVSKVRIRAILLTQGKPNTCPIFFFTLVGAVHPKTTWK